MKKKLSVARFPDTEDAGFQALLEEARFAFKSGVEYTRTLDLCRRALSVRPSDVCTSTLADLLEMASVSVDRLGESKARVPNLQAAVVADATDGEARFKLGLALDTLGENNAALVQYKTALAFTESIWPECHRDSLNNIGWYHFRCGSYREALSWFERACQFHVPDDPGPYHLAMENMLLVYTKLREREQAERMAVEYIEQFGRIPSTETRALRQLGIDADVLFIEIFLEDQE